MHRWLKMPLILLMVVVVAIGCAPKAAAPTAPEKVIKVGILGALTGPLRSIGEGATGCYDYFVELNATQGGVKYKDPKTGKEEVVRIEPLLADHGWDAAKCLSLYERFKQAGVKYVFANGSAPAAAIYAACARDQIPGQQIDCTSDPFIYQLPEPYLAMCAPNMATSQCGIIAYRAEQLRKAGIAKPKIGLLAADVPTRRVYDNDKDFGFLTYVREVAKVDLVHVYMPVAPVDVKPELTRMLNEGVNFIEVDHWGDGACAVVLKNAIELEMHKRGIGILFEWPSAAFTVGQIDAIREYKKYAHVGVYAQGWSGGEASDVVAKYPGLKLAFDLRAKYHRGSRPPGYQYIYGTYEATIARQVFQRALEKVGYEGLTGKVLKDTLFGMEVLDTGGLMPTYYPDPKVFMTWPAFVEVEITDNGELVCDPYKRPWIAMGASRVYPDYKPRFAPEWLDRIYFAPPMPPELAKQK